jgi:hypothetical protein
MHLEQDDFASLRRSTKMERSRTTLLFLDAHGISRLTFMRDSAD